MSSAGAFHLFLINIADGLPIDDLAPFSVSRTDVVVYRKGDTARSRSELVWMDRAGKILQFVPRNLRVLRSLMTSA